MVNELVNGFSIGKADIFFGSSIALGIISLIPDLKYALQIILLLVGICSGIASFLYYRAATKKLNGDDKE